MLHWRRGGSPRRRNGPAPARMVEAPAETILAGARPFLPEDWHRHADEVLSHASFEIFERFWDILKDFETFLVTVVSTPASRGDKSSQVALEG